MTSDPTADVATVTLTDLEVIQRWSLAVRQADADRDEVVAALRADLAWLTGASAPAQEAEADAPAPRRTTRPAAKRTTTRRKA